MPETPKSHIEHQEAPERLPLTDALSDLETILGSQYTPIPEDVTEKELLDEEQSLIGDGKIDSFNEQYRYNELLYRRSALQREVALEKKNGNTQVLLEELIVANQAATYHEYFQNVINNNVLATLRKYEDLRKRVPNIPHDFVERERQAAMYVRMLTQALHSRVDFSNIMIIDAKLAAHPENTAQLLQQRNKLVASIDLPENASIDDKRVYANNLNQRIIDILSGKVQPPGAQKDFLPQKLYGDLLQFQYEQLFEKHARIAMDPNLVRMQARFDELLNKGESGEELSREELSEFEELTKIIKDRNGERDLAKQERLRIVNDIIALTQDMGRHQGDLAELTAIQHQFGTKIDLTSNQFSPEQTPKEVREAIANTTEQRLDFHLGRLESFKTVFEEEVLDTGITERVEDFSNTHGRELVRKATNKLAGVVSYFVPDVLGAKGATREWLSAPLNEALGFPPGKTDWDQLTDKEKQEVEKKSRSVLDAINEFDTAKMNSFTETVSLIRTMPRASEFAGKEVDMENVSSMERVTAQNRDALIQKYGAPAVFIKLFEQMDSDWGASNPPSGFMGEHAKLLHSINDVVDVHIDVAEAERIIGERYASIKNELLKYAALAGIIGIIIGVTGTVLWFKLAGKTIRFAGRGVRGTGSLIGRGIKRGVETVRGLGSRGSSLSQAEKAAEGAARSGRIGRVLGPLGIVLIAVELKRVMERDSRLKELQEVEGVEAAIELMELKGNKNAFRYKAEMSFLHKRLDAIVIEDGAEKLLHELEKRFPSGQKNADAESIKTRCEELMKKARADKLKYEKLFPITDYLMTDPKRPQGNVGVNIRDLDDARRRGMEYERQQVDYYDLSNFFKNRSKGKPGEIPNIPGSQKEILKKLLEETKDKGTFSDLHDEYLDVLDQGAQLLESVQ